jgi:hypothetical protein
MKKINRLKAKRADMIADGAYDGRYKQKVVRDKKKHTSKTWARKK